MTLTNIENSIMTMNSYQWLTWATALKALAQSGLAFCNNPFEQERYQAVRDIAAEILSKHSNLSKQDALDAFAQEIGYATPKLDVRGAVFKDNRILLVKEASDQLWTLPGGYVDVNYSPAEAVVKEICEESGFKTKVLKLIAVHDKHKHEHPPEFHHIHKLFFLCDIEGGSARGSIETTDVDFFAEDKLPKLSLGRTLESQIALCFKHYRCPETATDFD